MSGPTNAAAEAFDGRRWGDVHRALSSLPVEELSAPDLERLAVAAALVGRDDEAVSSWERAYRLRLAGGDGPAAALCAFWAAFNLMLRGDPAQSSGWLRRTETAMGERDCVAAGYLLIPALLGELGAGNPAGARRLADRTQEIAQRFGDTDLAALATLGQGQALLDLDEQAAGMARLDEAMLSVQSGEVGPIVAGTLYCAVVLACIENFDFARAAEWTAALDAWCGAQPDLVPYRGQCLVHQSQILQVRGDWAGAAATAASARDRLSDPPHPALGLASYQEAELLRLRGDLAAAGAAYERAGRAGYPPMPGLALLERARGDLDAAVAGIRRALIEAHERFLRPRLLDAAVPIFIDDGDLAAAGDAAAELETLANRSPSPVLRAMAGQAAGRVAIATGDLSAGLPTLRAAEEAWRALQMPYEAAQVSVLLARAYLALGDHSSADLELANARATFAELGARPDLDGLSSAPDDARDQAGLSARELEVLAEVASGKTNREIARDLSISAHTVGRHLENIFAKAGVSGRAAATAWAYEHDLL